MILQPGEKQALSLQGKYLLARKIQGKIVISDPAQQMSDTEIKQSDIFELPNSKLIYVKNISATAAEIELQSSTVKIISNDGGSVIISGGSIDSIIEPIAVTAEATVENGTVTNQSPDTVSQALDITIAAGATVTLLAASPTDKRRVCLFQNISDATTVLRVGGAPTATAGALLAGSIDAIATMEIDTIGEIKAHNASATAAKVSVMWSKR